MEQLGKYGFLRRDYLKNHRNSTYQVMFLRDTIEDLTVKFKNGVTAINHANLDIPNK